MKRRRICCMNYTYVICMYMISREISLDIPRKFIIPSNPPTPTPDTPSPLHCEMRKTKIQFNKSIRYL